MGIIRGDDDGEERKPHDQQPRRLRSQLWFDNPDNPGMTALYLERYLNYGLTREELHVRQADHRHRADRLRSQPCNRHHLELAKRVREGIRDAGGIALRISGASDPGNRQAADRGARPQSRLSRPGRGAVRLSARRRRADDRLRQDHARLPDGGGDRQHAGHRALRRPDAQRLAERRAHGLGHRDLEGARGSGRRQDRLQGIHRHRRGLGAVDRPLQHHGHGLDHERAGRSARHVAARLRRDPGALSRARPDRLRDRRARGRDRARGSQAVRYSHARGVRERHRRLLGDRRLDQCADPYQRHRAAYRRRACDRGLGEDRLRRAAAGQHAAGRQISRRGIFPRRRIAGGDARIAAGQARSTATRSPSTARPWARTSRERNRAMPTSSGPTTSR